MEDQFVELTSFLNDPKAEVRQLAVKHVLSFTTKDSGYLPLFKKYATQVIGDLKKLCREPTLIAHDALSALINLSGDAEIIEHLDDMGFIKLLVLIIIIPKSILADVACMLLANISKSESVCVKLMEATSTPVDSLTKSHRVIDQLAEVFVKGYERQYNSNAEYHFLASVFANITTIPQGRSFFVEKAEDNEAPLTKITCFTEDSHVIRRGGVISTIKNCCFATQSHSDLLDEDQINILPSILLPLCGPEEFDLDDMDGMPEEVQLLPETKKREADPHLRSTLLEALVLLTTTREGREILRAKKVYPIVREVHLAEDDEEIQGVADRIVQMLMRDELPEEPKIVEDEDDQIVEM
ncbi:Protein hgh1 [Basidiobolus ranarum]|uniref:Protein HGH1 homolog n=1 Tax=Basidiobolus ranarum TaxID=34480 RepID=A0ABR2WZK1_9FUNG